MRTFFYYWLVAAVLLSSSGCDGELESVEILHPFPGADNASMRFDDVDLGNRYITNIAALGDGDFYFTASEDVNSSLVLTGLAENELHDIYPALSVLSLKQWQFGQRNLDGSERWSRNWASAPNAVTILPELPGSVLSKAMLSCGIGTGGHAQLVVSAYDDTDLITSYNDTTDTRLSFFTDAKVSSIHSTYIRIVLSGGVQVIDTDIVYPMQVIVSIDLQSGEILTEQTSKVIFEDQQGIFTELAVTTDYVYTILYRSGGAPILFQIPKDGSTEGNLDMLSGIPFADYYLPKDALVVRDDQLYAQIAHFTEGSYFLHLFSVGSDGNVRWRNQQVPPLVPFALTSSGYSYDIIPTSIESVGGRVYITGNFRIYDQAVFQPGVAAQSTAITGYVIELNADTGQPLIQSTFTDGNNSSFIMDSDVDEARNLLLLGGYVIEPSLRDRGWLFAIPL